MLLPPGYQDRASGRTSIFAWEGAADWAEATLGNGTTLHAWAAQQPEAKPLLGRGTAFAVNAPVAGPDGEPRWVVRRYHRGGLMAPLLGDRYLRARVPRPVRELWATVEARARGVPAPAVVAGGIHPRGPFYRGELVTEAIRDARTLEAFIFGGSGVDDASELLRLAGRLILTMEKSLVLHVDLNAANVLFVRERESEGAKVVDLDGCIVFPLDAKPFGELMRKRLERSLRKLSRRHGRPIKEREWDALRATYEDGV